MSNILQEIRYALRILRRRPVANLVIVLTLGIGIGANATFFAGFYGMVLRPLPFVEPDRLVAVFSTQPSSNIQWSAASAADLADWEAENAVFEEMAASTTKYFNIQFEEEPEQVDGAAVTADLFPMLGVDPLLGRHFLPSEDTPGGPLVTLISHRMWVQHFDGTPDVIGHILRIGGQAHEIVGVMPDGFHFPNEGQLWTPLAADRDHESRDRRRLYVFARLRDGVSIEQAQLAMTAIGDRLGTQYPKTNRGWGVDVWRLHDAWLPPVTQLASIAQQVLVCGVLLIVCANVANLILAQASVRRQEMSLRAALGASRGRLMRQTFVETMVLALGGGIVGTLLASWGEVWILSISSVSVPYWLSFEMDTHVLLYILGLTLLTGVLIGLFPAIKSSGHQLFESLKSGGRLEDPSQGFLRKALVVAEYAVALVVLVAGLLMVKSFDNVRRAETGFSSENILTLRLALNGPAYEEPKARSTLLDDLLQRVEGLPGVTSAGAANFLPISQSGIPEATLEVEGLGLAKEEEVRVSYQTVSRKYFSTLNIPLLAGRLFSTAEVSDGRPVVLLAQSLAEKLWPDRDPLGRRLRGSEESPWLEVVGIVGDVEPGQMIAGIGSRPEHQVYVPMGLGLPQTPGTSTFPTLILKTHDHPTTQTAAVRQELRRLAPAVPMFQVLTMDEVLNRFYFAQHLWSQMFSLIASVAFLIAGIGAYGVTAYSMSRRTRELGIRIALGAKHSNLLVLVVRQGLLLAVVGIGLGLLTAVPLAHTMGRLLHEMSPLDPQVFSTVVALLLAIGCLANYLPARRVTQVDPITALRVE